MKEKLVILFPQGNLPYSPTTLNLIRFLSNHFHVSVLEIRGSQDCDIDGISFTSIPLNVEKKTLKLYLALQMAKRFLNLKGKRDADQSQDAYILEAYFKQIKKILRKLNPDKIIAVDLFALHCCARLNLSCFFLSLEIPARNDYAESLAHKGIEGVIIQSLDRYTHLFGHLQTKPVFFILPNAPVYEIPEKRTVPSRKLVYNGAIWSAFGPQFCLSLITKYPEYELHLKGLTVSEKLVEVYFPFLLNSGALFIDQGYLQQRELNRYVQNFSIGFSFYHFEHPFIKENEFNYQTGPSGKLYTYLANGLPVVCSKIKAFEFVANSGAGILIDDYSPDAIKNAIEEILSDYQLYSDNALKLAEKSCFKKNVEPVIDHIRNTKKAKEAASVKAKANSVKASFI